MVIKVYLSGISASKEVKKRQQRALFILDSLRVKYENVDITEPGHEEDKKMIQDTCKKRDGCSVPLPPQFFNEEQYCGDWFDFDAASDEDTVLTFLKLEDEKQETETTTTTEGETKSAVVNGKQEEREASVEPINTNNESQSNVDSEVNNGLQSNVENVENAENDNEENEDNE